MSDPPHVQALSERFALLDHMPVGVCVLQSDYTVVFWNSCLAFWTGIETRDILGHTVTDFVPELGEAQYRSRLETVFQGGPPALFSSHLHKHLFPTPPGSRPHIRQTTVVAVPAHASLKSGTPDAFYALLTVEDATELTRKVRDYQAMHQKAREEVARREILEEEKSRMEQRAHHMQKLESLGILASGISHDFNNLLAVIVGNADIVTAGVSDPDLVLRCAAEINKAAARASDLVNQILSYSGGGIFHLGNINLSTLIEEMRYLLTAPIGKDISVDFQLDSDLPDIIGDSSQIQQILLNLVSNASESIGEELGTITITTGTVEADQALLATTYLKDPLPEGTYATIEVTDTGSGLDTEILEKVFDPFFTTKFAGRGLGLAAVLGIVRAHKGDLRVKSKPGEGATFTILLPVATSERTAEPDTHEPRRISNHKRQRGALLIDDEAMVLELGKLILTENGYHVLVAGDANQALAIFKEHRDEIDIVLLDVILPGRGGIEVATALHEIDVEVPIILFSGSSEAEARSRFTGIEIAGFLKKPFGAETMLETIDHVLSN